MNIEITRGRSEIYDILTHLTFMFIESHKIAKRVIIDDKGTTTRDWVKLEAAVLSKKKLSQKDKELAITHTGNILGRTFEEILEVYDQFSTAKRPDHFLHLIYWLGKRAMGEIIENSKRVINFSPVLRERLGHHIHGEAWANTIKETLKKHKLLDRPIHIISANVHSVMNTLHAPKALKSLCAKHDIFTVYEILSKEVENKCGQLGVDWEYMELCGAVDDGILRKARRRVCSAECCPVVCCIVCLHKGV
jgi:hypothetical protein